MKAFKVIAIVFNIISFVSLIVGIWWWALFGMTTAVATACWVTWAAVSVIGWVAAFVAAEE